MDANVVGAKMEEVAFLFRKLRAKVLLNLSSYCIYPRPSGLVAEGAGSVKVIERNVNPPNKTKYYLTYVT